MLPVKSSEIGPSIILLGTGKPGGLQSIGLQSVGHDLVTEQQKTTVYHQIKWLIGSTHCFLRFRKQSYKSLFGLFWWLSGQESTCQFYKSGFDSWVRKIPWRWKWQPIPVFLPGKSHRDAGGLQSMGLQKSWTRLSDRKTTIKSLLGREPEIWD